MRKITNFIIVLLLSFSVAFLRSPLPSFAFTTLQTCFVSAQSAKDCASAGVIPAQKAAGAGGVVAGAITPANIAAGTAALAYLTWQNAKDYENSLPPAYASYGVYRVADNALLISGAWCWVSYYAPYNNYSWWVGSKQQTGGYSPAYSTNPASHACRGVGVPLAPTVPDNDYLNLGAAAAIAAANQALLDSLASSPDGDETLINLAIAAAAAALNSAIKSGNTSLIAAANAASTAANSALATNQAAATAAKAKQDADKAAADKLAPPSTLPEKSFAGSVNFVTFTLTAMSTKFPFDIVYGATNSQPFTCPSFTLFFYQWQLCFLLPLFTSIRWIIFIGLSTKFIMEF